ncbi:hypothetical protein D3C83_144030 [compost metagenome]
MRGLKLLEDRNAFNELAAICMPGVGDPEIIDATSSLCIIHKTLLITSEKDLYDYLTQLK